MLENTMLSIFLQLQLLSSHTTIICCCSHHGIKITSKSELSLHKKWGSWMKYVTFIILDKILINIRYSLLLLFNIFLTYFAISATFTCNSYEHHLGLCVIALYIGLFSLNCYNFSINARKLLLPSISGCFHTTDYTTCSIALPPF